MNKWSRIPATGGHLRATTKNLERLMEEVKANGQTSHECGKPPLGIMPERLYEDNRIGELCAAILRQLKLEDEDSLPDYKLIHKWAEEICRKTDLPSKSSQTAVRKPADVYYGPDKIPADIVLQSNGQVYHTTFYPLTGTFIWPYEEQPPHAGDIISKKDGTSKRIISKVTVWSYSKAQAKVETVLMCEVPND